MVRHRNVVPTGITALLVLLVVPHRAQADRPTDAGPASGLVSTTRPLPEDQPVHLVRAEQLLREKSYDQGLKLLEDILACKELEFAPMDGGRRLVSVRLRANELIAALPAEQLDKYRQAVDPRAKALYEQALADKDARKLVEVLDRYLSCSCAPQAMESLGDMDLDSGDFGAAARHFENAIRRQKGAPAEARLLAKLAAALYQDGQVVAGNYAWIDLRDRFPRQEDRIGGRQVNLLEYAEGFRAKAVAAASQPAGTGWPGAGAFIGNVGVMGDGNAALSVQWRYPADLEAARKDLAASLIASSQMFSFAWARSRDRAPFSIEISGGHLQGQFTAASSSVPRGDPMYQPFTAPSSVHPVVADGKAIFRTDDGLVACDVVSGEVLWKSVPFPVQHYPGREHANDYSCYSDRFGIRGNGRYVLTVGDGKVFALGGFLAPAINSTVPDSSALAALSTGDGKVLWRIGDGRGDDDLVKGCKFLTPPACRNGKLYVLCVNRGDYHLLCLRADTGGLVWKQGIGQRPGMTDEFRMDLSPFYDVGSTPAVADGRVYVLTNTGLVAAVEAQTGQPVWAWTYKRHLPKRFQKGGLTARELAGLSFPANPVLVMDGKVICLPIDSAEVFALSVEDGRVLWSVDRQGLDHLTALPRNRLALSGDKLVLLAASGSRAADPASPGGLEGRPAVGPKAMWVSGQGKLYRVDLESYDLSAIDLPKDPRAVLGNLVFADGKLIAANATGVAAYFDADAARNSLLRQSAEAPPGRQGALLLGRGQMALASGRYQEAVADLRACAKAAEESSDKTLADRARLPLAQALVALAFQTKDAQEKLSLLREARPIAAATPEGSRLMLPIAKGLSDAGDAMMAVAIAQKLVESPGQDEMVAWPQGCEPVPASQPGVGGVMLARPLAAQQLMAEIIAAKGRGCYEAYDTRAAKAFATAANAADPNALLAVARQWPNSASADKAKYAAAEIFYRQAVANLDGRRENYLRAAMLLNELEAGKGPLAQRAIAAVAAILARGGLLPPAASDFRRTLPPDETQVEFADIRGRLGELLKAPAKAGLPLPPSQLAQPSFLPLPIHEHMRLTGDVWLMRDRRGHAIRVGQSIFILRSDKNLVRFNTASADPARAVIWTTPTPFVNGGVVAGVSEDQKLLTIGSKGGAATYEVATGKELWRKPVPKETVIADVAYGENHLIFTTPDSNVICIDPVQGVVKWRSYSGYSPADRFVGSPICIDNVVGGVINVVRCVTEAGCVSLEDGRILGRWNGDGACLAVFPSGVFVISVDHTLTAYDRRKPDTPLWRTTVQEYGLGPMIIGNTPDRIILRCQGPEGKGRGLAVYSPKDGKRLALFSTDWITDERDSDPVCPCLGEVYEDEAYIVGDNRHGGVYHWFGQGLIFQKYDLTKAEGKPVWTSFPVKSDHSFSRLSVGYNCVAIAAKREDPLLYHTLVLDGRTGEVRYDIPLVGVGREPPRYGIFCPPTILNGRLVLATENGISIYAGQ